MTARNGAIFVRSGGQTCLGRCGTIRRRRAEPAGRERTRQECQGGGPCQCAWYPWSRPLRPNCSECRVL